MDNKIITNETKKLIAGTFPIVTMDVTLLSGKKYSENTLLALDSTNKIGVFGAPATAGKYDNYLGILPKEVDATAQDIPTTILVTGEFHEDALVFETGATLDKFKLKDKSIFIK